MRGKFLVLDPILQSHRAITIVGLGPVRLTVGSHLIVAEKPRNETAWPLGKIGIKRRLPTPGHRRRAMHTCRFTAGLALSVLYKYHTIQYRYIGTVKILIRSISSSSRIWCTLCSIGLSHPMVVSGHVVLIRGQEKLPGETGKPTDTSEDSPQLLPVAVSRLVSEGR